MKTIQKLLEYLKQGKTTKQNTKYHPEGDVYTHSLLTFWGAFYATSDVDIVTAALFHDIGKVNKIPKEQKGHELSGYNIVKGILNEKQAWLIKNHKLIEEFMRGKKVNYTQENGPAPKEWFDDLNVLYKADRAARTKVECAKIAVIEVTMQHWLRRIHRVKL